LIGWLGLCASVGVQCAEVWRVRVFDAGAGRCRSPLCPASSSASSADCFCCTPLSPCTPASQGTPPPAPLFPVFIFVMRRGLW
jgi:hypothetical protein